MKKLLTLLVAVALLQSCVEEDVMSYRKKRMKGSASTSVPPKEAIKAIKKVTEKKRG